MVSRSFVGYAALTDEIVPIKYGTGAIVDIETGEIVPVVRKEVGILASLRRGNLRHPARTISGNSSRSELSLSLQEFPALPELLEPIDPL
jgi:hypothetical protein